jgi:hypothetical protein
MFARALFLPLFLSVPLLFAGCASVAPSAPRIDRLPEGSAGPLAPARTGPLSLDEVVALSRDGTPPQTVIQMLRDSRATYALSAEEAQKLTSRGVSPEVVAFLRGPDVYAAQHRPAYVAPYPVYPYPYYYGAPYYGLGYGELGYRYPYRTYPRGSIYFGFGRRW